MSFTCRPADRRLGQLAELVRRDLRLARLIRRHDADLVVTRNPAGVQAARALGVPGIFDTDDGSAAGIHFKAARPFAHFLTSPDCLPEYWGNRHWRYPGYKQGAYLHPDHFTPDAGIKQELGVDEDERFFIVRFVAMNASHDKGETGMSYGAKREVIERLQKRGRVFLSCEGETPAEWEPLRFKLPPHRLHHALAFAHLIVGDSQTMAAEAAVLGTPAVRASTFVGRISYLQELEHRYGLTWGFHPRDADKLLDKLDALLAEGDELGPRMVEQQQVMLGDKINVADWFVDFMLQRSPV
jgi:predicted glycosyltransferase